MQSLTDERIIIEASSSDYILIRHESNRDTYKFQYTINATDMLPLVWRVW